MASHTFSGKRRRLNHAPVALSKPFKSPLRRPTPTVQDETTFPEKQEETDTTSTQTTMPDKRNVQNPFSPPMSTNSLATPPSSRKRTMLGQRLTPARKPILPDLEILNLQKEQQRVQSRLSSLCSELDTVQQALRIESSTRDKELEALIVKWKQVSQDAAEEVFTGAQERISRMGGVKAWRAQMKNIDNRWEQEETESWLGNVDAEGVDMDEDEVKARQAEMRDEIEKRKKVVEQGDEPEEFTMDMMLKTLNIDLKTIGYDRSYERWIRG
ncbi:hypothetical protein BDW59DRAFT_89152 [Aspergillus cavernicola]|uniref:DNA repair protein Dds20/Sfr1 n=1 Tax=Aspergillus cavernicola TaxID=176166 RepID=A0ABR4I8U0_9EURO